MLCFSCYSILLLRVRSVNRVLLPFIYVERPIASVKEFEKSQQYPRADALG